MFHNLNSVKITFFQQKTSFLEKGVSQNSNYNEETNFFDNNFKNIHISDMLCCMLREQNLEGFVYSNEGLCIRKGMIDSGCNEHISGDIKAMENVREIMNKGYVKGFRNSFIAAPSYVGDNF